MYMQNPKQFHSAFDPNLPYIQKWWIAMLSIFNPIFISVPISYVSGLQGLTGVLPCDVTTDTHGSSQNDVSLILWFKDNATKPMYR